MSAKSKISHLLSKDYALGIFLVRLILYLVSTGLGIFDTYTDWELVLQFQRNGFNHPLLRLDLHWLRAWYFFAILGTIFTIFSISNETIDIFYSLWLFSWKYLCRCCRKTNVKKDNNNTHNDMFEMKKRNDTDNTWSSETEKEKAEREQEVEETDEDVVITDACKCCYRCGWNFTTRAKTVAKLSLWLQDVPMLMLAVLYAFSQTSCKLPEAKDVTGDLFNVGLSALASTAAIAFRLTRSMLRLCASVGLRIKSKKQVRKMGKWCRFLSKILPEKGDAMYPPDTCAQCCIIPFYLVLIFDFILVFMGCVLSLIIWVLYFGLKRTPNFDDSLAIFRFQHTGESVHLLNISNNIIPASNGTFVSFETIQDDEDNEVTHCLSEFQYRKEDFNIFFNAIEVRAISDRGEFCAIRNGSDVDDFDTYSRCTLYYTLREFVLFYGSTNRFSGKITRFDEECIIVKDRPAGPDLDLSIQVEKNIDRTDHPSAIQDLQILYVSIQNSTARVLTYISVADIMAGGLDKTYFHTFQDPSNGTNTTYLFRFFYDHFSKQFTYNVREVYNYPPPRNGSCTCSSILNTTSIRRFLGMGIFMYGYFDRQLGRYRLLQNCSSIPLDKLIPQYYRFLFVSCSYLCG